MGKILDDWMARNSGYLATLVPGAGRPQLALAPQPQPQPMPGFGGASAPANGSSFAAQPGQSSFAPPLQAAQVTPQQPPASGMAPPSGPTRTGAGKDNYGVKQLVEGMSDPELTKLTDQMTSQTGQTPQAAYKKITGNDPHKDMSHRELSEFLVEFGLGLLSAPAGMSDPEAFGRAGTAAYVSQNAKRAAAQTQARADEQTIYDRTQAERKYRDDRLDKSFDRDIKLQELDAKELEAISKFGKSPNDKFNHYVGDDGYMYSYDENTGQGVRVEINGKPVKPDPRIHANGERKLDFEVKYNMYLDTYGQRPDGSKLTGPELTSVQKSALEFANRTKDYTDEEAQREAVKGAIDILKNDSNYLMSDPDQKAAMRSAQVAEIKNLLKPPAVSNTPDAAKLTKGMATPVTDDKGTTNYWTLGEDGKPRKVDPAEMH